MPMNETIKELLELARIDRQLVKYRKRVLAGPREIAQKEEACRAQKNELDRIRNEVRVHALEGDRHALDAHTAAAETSSIQQRLNTVKNNAEYAHYTNRLRDLREIIDREESIVLKNMEVVDRLRERERAQTAEVEAAKAELEQLKADVAREAEDIRLQQRDLKAKREIQLKRVSETNADAPAAYNAALQRTRGDAMALMVDEVCQACFRRQNPSVLNAILLATDTRGMTCPGCGRLLHLAPDDNGAGPADDSED